MASGGAGSFIEQLLNGTLGTGEYSAESQLFVKDWLKIKIGEGGAEKWKELCRNVEEEDSGEEAWEEPEEDAVCEGVWTEIRQEGFAGRRLKNRDLKRVWARRAKIANEVELLELGRAGGALKRKRMTNGAMMRACLGGGQRCVVAVSRPAEVHEAQGGEEGGNDGR